MFACPGARRPSIPDVLIIVDPLADLAEGLNMVRLVSALGSGHTCPTAVIAFCPSCQCSARLLSVK